MNDRGITPSTIFGEGALSELPKICETLRARHLLLVVDEIAYRLSGAADALRQFLPPDAVTLFTDFEPNPKLEDVMRGVEKCRSVKPDLVVALGGGTAIDLAKMIGSMALQEESPRDIAVKGLPLQRGTLPLIAIPTTAGTGSEATHFAVVYVDGEKYSVADPCLLPAFALIDPQLTYSLPPTMTAATGLDTFCQAIESIWAVGATSESIEFAKEAAQLALRYLPEATHRPTPEARRAMCCASNLAGQAINISKTTLPHAISYSITADYGLPHGAAVATTLSSVMAFNFGVSARDCADRRGLAYVQKQLDLILEILEVPSVDLACQRIESFVDSLGCSATPFAAGITSDESLNLLASRVNTDRLSNNPRAASHDDLVSMLKVRTNLSPMPRPLGVAPRATSL
ncbi:phosphonoacetaldehyde reductase [Bremerella cremea]|uniref:phosphonoacetaldehyde reductase n=1 Tax=Bremerella cremea TaxID=1031537 RepID=UPI0031EB5F50